MTDINYSPDALAKPRSEEREARIKRRYRAELRFKIIGLSAILASILFLVFLLYTIVLSGLPAFTYHYVTLPVDVTEIDRAEVLQQASENKRITANFNKPANAAILSQAPYVSGRKKKKLVRGLISNGSGVLLRTTYLENENLSENAQEVEFLVSDFVDLYLKGLIAKPELSNPNAAISVSEKEGDVTINAQGDVFENFLGTIQDHLAQKVNALEKPQRQLIANLEERRQIVASAESDELVKTAQDEISSLEGNIAFQKSRIDALIVRRDNALENVTLDSTMPSLLLRVGGGVVKVSELGKNIAKGQVIAPLENVQADAGAWTLQEILSPEDNRKFKDLEVVIIDQLDESGKIRSKFNSLLFSKGDSREPELAGVWGAVVGSFFTMIITLALSFPLGVAAAIYLEEFAPKNRLTDLIEVNINNLAAVPSIVFGLLGLAVFLSFFGFTRSAPVVGGMVLALMTLPTIIIAARTALKSVPPSIREAALGVGASKLQAVFHHVLPLAIPGILTGAIIGMARALGETAPLLMIGMFAFVADVPDGFTSKSTVLPVQIFLWADAPEPGFQQKTAAAIMVLLAFLVAMNALAVFLRKRFERRW